MEMFLMVINVEKLTLKLLIGLGLKNDEKKEYSTLNDCTCFY